MGGTISKTGAGADAKEESSGFLTGALASVGGLGGILGLKKLLSGKGGLFSNLARNIKAIFLKQGKALLGTSNLLKLLRGAGFLAKLGGLSVPILGFIIDGFLGYFNADKWETSKLAGIIGGVLGGGEGGGLNAVFNSLKMGAAGAAIGTAIFPGVGTIIGGIAGAILGAILGFFGGDKIAKAIDAVTDYVSSKFDSFLKFLGIKETTKEEKLDILFFPCIFNDILEGSAKPVESSSSDPNPNCK